MKVSRTSRLNDENQKEISEIIRMHKDRMPGVKGMISITEADVAPDLKTAYIYVSVYGAGDTTPEEVRKALQEQAGYIRHELAQVMHTRTVPVLTFRLDNSMVYGAKMDELFKNITYSTPETTDED